MSEFIKSILNYYAAFTETRFSNKSNLYYKWLEDENLTLDITFFPEFRALIFDKLKFIGSSSLKVLPSQFKVEISQEEFKEELFKELNSNYNLNFLNKCIFKEEKQYRKEIENKKLRSKENKDLKNRSKLKENSIDNEENQAEAGDRKIFLNSIRRYNIELRKKIEEILKELQAKKLLKLTDKYNITKPPPISFNSLNFSKDIFENLRKIADKSKEKSEYYKNVLSYFKQENFEFILFDLYQILKIYAACEVYGTTYLFLDSIKLDKKNGKNDKSNDFPLAFIEASFDTENVDYILIELKNLVFINTPAINSFEFKGVLSIPRAVTLKESINYFSQVDNFIVSEYKLNKRGIILTEKPYRFKGFSEEVPDIKFKTGFQIIKNEDKRILDYSELMTKIEEGVPSKFSKFINNYIKGNVSDTINEINETYREKFPTNSSKNFMSDNPLPLNKEQRKILMALDNDKNEIIVVEGPPGTGKSHTIAAITYWANQMNKSVVITSHKKEALDVVDRILTDKFKELHPYSKPSIIRLDRDYYNKNVNTINTIENSLASSVISSATSRSYDFNSTSFDKDLDKTKNELDDKLNEIISKLKRYPEKLKKIINYYTIENELKIDGILNGDEFDKLNTCIDFTNEFELLEKFVYEYEASNFINLSLGNLTKIFQKKNEIHSVLEACETLNKIKENNLDLDSMDISGKGNLNSLKTCTNDLDRIFRSEAKILEIEIKKISIEKHDLQKTISSFEELIDIEKKLKKLIELKPKLFHRSNEFKSEENNFIERYLSFYSYIKKNKYSLDTSLKIVSEETEYIKSITMGIYQNSFIYSLSQKDIPLELITEPIQKIKGLNFDNTLQDISKLYNKEKSELTLSEIKNGVDVLENIEEYSNNKKIIDNFQKGILINQLSYKDLFKVLNKVSPILNKINIEIINSLNNLLIVYNSIFNKIEIDFNDLSTLFKLKSLTPNERKVFELIKLHSELVGSDVFLYEIKKNIDNLNNLNHRLTEFRNDSRLKNLNNHRGDIERIKTYISSRKRLPINEAIVLLSNYSCIITKPEEIFRYFPMEEDLIDILIFDEASQVSIAHSISLILRAKQVVVFGDKYQYGAVGAVNVSKRYAGSYFNKVIKNYSKEYNKSVLEGTTNKIINEESAEIPEEDLMIPELKINPDLDAVEEWIKTFSIRNSTLNFCIAISNFQTSLREHFRSFKEIIDYSNEFFYKKTDNELIVNRLRTKPIKDVLRFIKVENCGNSGQNVNLDEIEAIRKDMLNLINDGFSGTIGVISSFREQGERAKEYLRKKIPNFREIEDKHKITIWFVGDVQGEERDIVYYSFVQDNKLGNADLRTIYPVPGGRADRIESLKMQRLNVGFSRAKDSMVFIHSMDLKEYADTRLGEALEFYKKTLDETLKKDYFIIDESVFESPKEKELYNLIIQTSFYKDNVNNLKIVPQFEIGKYIAQNYHKYIPKYRTDFLITLSEGGKEKSLILEYDGIEYHTNNPNIVKSIEDFSQEYIEYDVRRQLELESYGYHFLRINKFTLLPNKNLNTKIDVLDNLLRKSFSLN